MPRPSAVHALGLSSDSFDKSAFLKYMDDFGRAYRNRAMELIDICRLFARAAPQQFEQDAELSDVFKVCDDALTYAVEAREEATPAADQAFKEAIRRLHVYESTHHALIQNNSENTAEGRMESAKKKDEEKLEPETWTRTALSRFRSIPPKRRRRAPDAALSSTVEFHLRKSPTDSDPAIVRQALAKGSKLQEILWNFSRFPNEKRVRLAQNPHFYEGLDPPPNTSWDSFSTGPIECYLGTDPIYVLTNMLGRIFFEFGKDWRGERAFDNIWKTNEILIFKGVSGKLEGESLVGASLRDKDCLWCDVELPPSPPGAGPATVSPNSSSPPTMATSSTKSPAWKKVKDWKVATGKVLDSPGVKIRIKHP